MGVLSRLWKAFQITIGIGATNNGSPQEQWHAHAERQAAREEANIQASLNEMRRQLVKLGEQKSSLTQGMLQGNEERLEVFSKSLKLAWERQWAFMGSCALQEADPSSKEWCGKASAALLTDAKSLKTLLQEETQALLLPALENSQLSHFKELFNKTGLNVSPELLLASNACSLKNDLEVKPLGQVELLSQMLALFDTDSAVPTVQHLKEALSVVQEVQEKVIVPFREYAHGLDPSKYTGGGGMQARLQKAVSSFKKILSDKLKEFSKTDLSTKKRSILIPGGLMGSDSMLAKLTPYLSKFLVQWTKENQYIPLDINDFLQNAESWLFTASKVAYYEIELEPDRKYTFRIYYGSPNAAHPEEMSYEGNTQFESVVSMSGITEEALLSDAVLHTLIETQLVGDIVREVAHLNLDVSPLFKNRNSNTQTPNQPAATGKMKLGWVEEILMEKIKQTREFVTDKVTSAAEVVAPNLQAIGTSLFDTLSSVVGAKQANWDEKQFEEGLFSVLGGKRDLDPVISNSASALSSSSEWNALLAVLQQAGASSEESERLVIAVRLAFLHHFCKSADPEQLGNNEQALAILSAAKQSLARWTLSSHEHRILNENDLRVIQLVVSEATQLIDHAQEVEALRLRNKAPLVVLKAPLIEQPLGSIKLSQHNVQSESTIKTPDFIYLPIEQVVDWHPTADNWAQDLRNFSNVLLKEIDQRNVLPVIDAVELMAEKSEKLLSFVNTLPKEEVEATITAIGEIAHAYFIAHFDLVFYPDARGFATIMTLLELGEELRRLLPEELGLSGTTLYGNVFEDYLSEPIPMSFRLYDPAWDKRIKRIAQKNSEHLFRSRFMPQQLLSMGLEILYGLPRHERFGASGEMGLGLWRYRQAFSWLWPLGFEAERVDNQISAYGKDLPDLPIFGPLFNASLPYQKAFAEKFPEIAKNGTLAAQAAAAYEDTSESSLPKPFYDLRKLGTIARYFLRSPFASVNGTVKDRHTYTNEFHAVHTPEVSIPVPQFILDTKWVSNPKIKLFDEKVRFFSEVPGIDQELFDNYPRVVQCSDDDFNSCHRFVFTHDLFQNKLLQHLSRHLKADRPRPSLKHNWFSWNELELNRKGLNINQAMVNELGIERPGGLDWKDSVRLSALFSHPDTQVASAASFFSNRLDLFEGEGKKEWRALLQQALFEPGLLLEALSDPTRRGSMIRALDFFCDKGYRYFHSLQKNEAAAYFLDISLLITRYMKETHQKEMQEPADLKILNSSLIVEKLREAVAVKGTLIERYKGPLAGVLAKHLLDEYKIYSEGELAEILEAVMLYYRYPSQANAESRQRRDALVKGMRRIAPQVKRLMADDTKREVLLKKLVERVDPSAEAIPLFATDAARLRYASQGQDIKIDLLEGRYLRTGLGDQTLPIEALKDPSYQAVFGNHEPLVTLLSAQSWEFTDRRGYVCRISKEGSKYQILRQINERWYRYTPPDSFSEVPVSDANRQIAALEGIEDRTTPLGSLQFIDGCTHWHHEASPSELLLLDAKTNQPRYRVALAHSNTLSAIGGKDMVHAIYDLSHTPSLKLVNIYKEAHQFAWLENVEDPRHLTVWSDSKTGELKRIELPRYRRFSDPEQLEGENQEEKTQEKLSFTVRDQKAYCDQIPEYYLESRQYCQQLPFLKSLIILRNAEGDQKIILPTWEPLAQPGLSARPVFLDPRSKAIKQHDYVVLEKAKEKARFVGVDIQATLYQALLLQTQHRYSEAAENLSRHGHNPKAYSTSQRKLLESIIQFAMKLSRDEQPDAYIPAMQAVILLIKDHTAHGSAMKEIDPYVKPLFLAYYKNRAEGGYSMLNDENIALAARYLLERENSFHADVKKQYLELSEIDPAAAHRGLAEYAHKVFFQMNAHLNQGMDFLGQLNLFRKSDATPPYKRLSGVSEFELIELVQSAISKKKPYLATGLMLQPTEMEFSSEFLPLIKKMQKGSEQERKAIADRCRLMQSPHKQVMALGEILIQFAEHPEHFLKALSAIDPDKEWSASDAALLVPKLFRAAKEKAPKQVGTPQKGPDDYLKFAFDAFKQYQEAIPQFTPEKFASKPVSEVKKEGLVGSIPEPVPFGSLMEEWKGLLIQSQNRIDPEADPATERYTKIFSPYLSNNGIAPSRQREESLQLLHSIKAYLAGQQGIFSFKTPEARMQMIEKRDFLKSKILADERELVDRELNILAFFNRESSIKADLSQAGGVVKKRALPELILLFARKELSSLSKEGGLSAEEIRMGSRLIANYLTLAKHRDSLKYGLLPLADKLAALKPAEYGLSREQELLEEIAAQLDAKPQVDPEEVPAVSGFEYVNRLLVRGEQWEKIQELLEFFKKAIAKTDGAPRHLVLKLEMGFGKSLLVTPIYAFCAATGERLMMALMPKELIPVMLKEISGILGDTYAQLVQFLDFDRNSEFTVERLEDILSTLTNVKKERQFLMMSPQSVRSFYLKFIETWDQYSKALAADATDDQEYVKKIELMRKILNMWGAADVLFDEADLILNPRHRLSFAIGASKNLPEERLGLTVELYRVLAGESFQNASKLNLEFLKPSDKGQQEPLTPAYYHEQVKPIIARMMLDRLSQKVQNAQEVSSFATNFPELSETIKNWSPSQLEQVYSFILDIDITGQGHAFLKNLKNEKLYQLFCLLKGQLNEKLPLTLNRNYAERYGFHKPGDAVAGPYSGSMAPNKGSQFTDVWEISNYSIQAHLKKGDYKKLIGEIVAIAREQAQKEKMVRGCTLDETTAFIRFETTIGKRSGVSLFQENAVDKISGHALQDMGFQYYLIENFILPEIREFTEELSATSQAFSLIFDVTKEYSGTPWNWQTFPQGTKVSAIASTDGAALVPLYKKSADRFYEVTLTHANRTVSLFTHPSFKDAQVFIDAGALLKGIPHEEVCRQLFTLDWFKNAFDGCLFFDEKENKKILEKGEQAAVAFENSNVPMHRLFTFYDQKHCTGTNIKQMPQAKGVISVSKHMILRDYMQGGKRLRKLHKGQQLDTIIEAEDARVIKETLNLPKNRSLGFDDAIFYLWKQQLDRMGEENALSAPHKMESKLQRPIFELMKDPSEPPREIAKWFPQSRSLFFKGISDNPAARYAQQKSMQPKDLVIEMKADEVLKPAVASLFLLEKSFRYLGLNSLEALKNWTQSAVNKEHLDEMLITTNGSHDHETEMELEQEQEVEQEEETENQIEQQMEEEVKINTSRKPAEHDFFVVGKILTNEPGASKTLDEWIKSPRLKGYMSSAPVSLENQRRFNSLQSAVIFDPSIHVSLNQMYSYSGAAQDGGQREFKPVEYALVYIINKGGKKQYELTLIDTNDASDAERQLRSLEAKINPSEEGWALYAFGVGQVQHAGLAIDGKPGHEEKKLLTLLVQAKFADGEIYYNEKEQKVLETWIRKSGVDLVESEMKYILRDQRARRDAYPQSSLGSIIKKIKEEKMKQP